ncbi:MAG: DNA polymerase Y family protein [Planctomycetaceae bacterium]|nr:DNA polymerase Y family protein [Planctomycetaceae bacterium]MBT4159102.1 DNA polymerase Y family protein [Planctomycetaceae bacterium]
MSGKSASRIMTVVLPRWPVQRQLLQQPGFREFPVFVCRKNARGVLSVVSWAWVMPPETRRGFQPVIQSGFSLSEALAVLTSVYGEWASRVARILHEDSIGDIRVLETLGRWCHRFSPVVAIGPDVIRGKVKKQSTRSVNSLQIDVSDTARFFGGELSLVRMVVWVLAARGIHARAAIADTPAASWVAALCVDRLAAKNQQASSDFCKKISRSARGSTCLEKEKPRSSRHGHWLSRQQRWVLVPSGQQRQILGSMPIMSLRLPVDVVDSLAEVGVESISQLLRLPRVSLQERFGPVVSLQISRFLGEASDPLTPLQESDLSGATHSFELPVLSRDLDYKYFRQLIESLVHQCIRPLVVTNRGASSLQVRLGTNGVRGSTILEVGLYKPTAKTSHLVDLVMLRFERTHLPREITGVSVEVLSADALPCRQQTLFRSPVQSDMSQFEILLNRLTSRLGSGAVVEPQLLSDIQPEASWVAAPVVHVMGTSGSCRSGHAHESKKTQVSKSVVGPSRPIFLLSRPQLLEVSSLGVHGVPVRFSWKGRVHVVMRTRGPERIETAWWRGPTVRRDYYICETNLGGRFWIFRGLQKRAWFLHGTYG